MEAQLLTVALAAPRIHLAEPGENEKELLALAVQNADAGVILFPELAVTGSSCGDLFRQRALLEGAAQAVNRLAREAWAAGCRGLLAVGAPVPAGGRLFDCLVLCHGGAPVAVIPAACVDAGARRWFSPASAAPGGTVDWPAADGQTLALPFGADILVSDGPGAVVLAAEIGPDSRALLPPGAGACLAGADVLLCPDAEPETAGGAARRQRRVTAQAERCGCVYLYAGAGQTESTTDAAFSGHGMICEGGRLLASQLWPAPGGVLRAVVDIEAVRAARLRAGAEGGQRPACYRVVRLAGKLIEPEKQAELVKKRPVDRLPFVPADGGQRSGLCAEVARIQAAGLAGRLAASGSKRAVLGLSGGLDSTLALLVALQAMELLGRGAEAVLTVGMPCVGTTGRTRSNAEALARLLGAEYREVPILRALEGHLEDIGHAPDRYDAAFENAQARERTQILMDLANMENGLVVGTGDLSELALGWCTYGGDQMSMYGVNGSVPKTLVKALVAWHADRLRPKQPQAAGILLDILDTPISPELLPVAGDGTLVQKTEETLGSYELHDFALYHLLTTGYAPRRVFAMACLAFPELGEETVRATLRLFYRRFFSQQFKRSCMPDGAAAGPLSLSPRGGWQMPSDAGAAEFLRF